MGILPELAGQLLHFRCGQIQPPVINYRSGGIKQKSQRIGRRCQRTAGCGNRAGRGLGNRIRCFPGDLTSFLDPRFPCFSRLMELNNLLTGLNQRVQPVISAGFFLST